METVKELERDWAFKDVILDHVAEVTNVAQFISFDPDLVQRFARVSGFSPNHRFDSYQEGIRALLARCPDRTVNIRSFCPGSTKSTDFVYGQDVDGASNALRKLATQGLYTIVNETIDIEDGGVSGVALDDVIEFAPGDTPRCVDLPDVASLRRSVGIRLLEIVYGFTPSLDFPHNNRVEFSIHPIRRGVRNEHTIIWQLEQVKTAGAGPSWSWPNRFSRFIGDKAYGLLIADIFGLEVPRTTVMSRRLPPFSFGRPTGTGEIWIRTSPTEQHPGRFTTQPRWCDPFHLVSREDPKGSFISSVIAQEGVDATFSGKLDVTQGGELIIEGVKGKGDRFMVGRSSPDTLPAIVVQAVSHVYQRITGHLHPVSIEWVYDGHRAWVVQLHLRGISTTAPGIIVPGEPEHYNRFDVKRGIEPLRKLVDELSSRDKNQGIILVGNVGITSHFGDILRKSGIPSRIEYTGVAQQKVRRVRALQSTFIDEPD
jgi:hypothetical protein